MTGWGGKKKGHTWKTRTNFQATETAENLGGDIPGPVWPDVQSIPFLWASVFLVLASPPALNLPQLISGYSFRIYLTCPQACLPACLVILGPAIAPGLMVSSCDPSTLVFTVIGEAVLMTQLCPSYCLVHSLLFGPEPAAALGLGLPCLL